MAGGNKGPSSSKAKTPAKKKAVVKTKNIKSFFTAAAGKSSSSSSATKRKNNSPTSVTSTPKASTNNNKDDSPSSSSSDDKSPAAAAASLNDGTPGGTISRVLGKSESKKSPLVKKIKGTTTAGAPETNDNDSDNNNVGHKRSPRKSSFAGSKKHRRTILCDSSDDEDDSDDDLPPSKPPSNNKSSFTTEKKVKPSIKKLSSSSPKYPIGTSLCKAFIDPTTQLETIFNGKVVEYDELDQFYKIQYEDGDEEEMSEGDLINYVLLYKSCGGGKRKKDDDNDDDDKVVEDNNNEGQKKRRTSNAAAAAAKKREPDDEMDEEEVDERKPAAAVKKNAFDILTSGKNPRRDAKKKISYANNNEDESSDEEEVDDKPKKKKLKKVAAAAASKGGKNKKGKKSKKKKSDDSDSDGFQPDSQSEDDSFVVDDDAESEAMEVDSDSDSDGFIGKKTAKKKASAKKKPASSKKKETAATKKEDKTAGKELSPIEKLKAAKAKDITVKNNPQAFPDDGPYVEPVGMSATDNIVEGIIGAMVQKVGNLLLRAIQHDDADRDKCELFPTPLLNTACSGTDAPSISLSMIKEYLDSVLPGHGFTYEHNMSCEVEPFKQVYLAQNFPGAVLFPDIVKLTGGATVTDVYGREQTIPESNLFIAGTSCKDFSMLKSKDRKDIEDKGTSGETFLAAVEYLDQKQPATAIFENVKNAPWDKMSEYITGRINLSERNDTKNITGCNKGNADKDLKFEIDDQGRYVVLEVPKQVGVRAGCIVEGFVRGDDDPNDVQPVKGKQSDKGKTVTLGQLAKEHDISLDEDILVIEKKARYCTHLSIVDTKQYGLPQTRERRYLFVWRSDDPADNLGEYIQLIMDHLKTPLLHSMEAFLLPETDDRIRRFREALRSGGGQMVAREREKEKDFFDFPLSGVKDLAYHLNYREKYGINERSRCFTNWDTGGRKKSPPNFCPELMAMWNMRRLDLIDCFSATLVRDAISRDPNHHSVTWDLSQNVHRTNVRESNAGTSGCVTPGGELLLPHLGRTMMGVEKLLLQGIPFGRLDVGSLSEVQLSDLAGNAMSTTVICATMLAAMCAPQLRREQKAIAKVDLRNSKLSHKFDYAKGNVLSIRGDLHGVELSAPGDFIELFANIGNDHATDAFLSSALCHCETSGQTSPDDKMLECSSCGLGICHQCTSCHQIGSHSLKEIITSETKRPNQHEFEKKLRCSAPPVIKLGTGWEDAISEANGLESYSFQLQLVERKKGHWLMTYTAWEDHGSGRQVAEIRVALGQIGALQTKLGVAAYFKCFSPAIRHEKPKRGLLGDSARLILRMEGNSIDVESVRWEIRGTPTKSSLKLVGSDPVDSTRVKVGLNDRANKELRNHKHKAQFTKNFPKSRNNFLWYHKKWKTWPGIIDISGDDKNDISVNGSYKKMSCEHSVVLSALWRRDKTGDSPELYLYFRPDVMRTGLDVAVISTTPSYRDNMEICELQDWIPENTLVEDEQPTKVRFLSWDPAPALEVLVPVPTMVTENISSFHDQVDTSKPDSCPILCELSGLSKEVIKSILQHSTEEVNASVVQLDLYRQMGSRNAKKLSIVAAPLLLKLAADGRLPLELLHWYKLSQPERISFGLCQTVCPIRPKEVWIGVKKTVKKGKKVTEETSYERESDAEASNEFYQNHKNRPSPFEVSVDKADGKLIIKMNPLVACHQAAARLIRGRGLADDVIKAIDVSYSLSELSMMGEPITKEFRVPNSDAYQQTVVEGMELPLYPRQGKALTRMRDIEAGKVDFTEEERSEHILNGIGWCLMGKASSTTPLKGGVLGDAIGSGKTVVTIACILSGIEEARANRSVKDGKSGATLIVVPPGLVKQWDDERKKFTKDKLKCIIVDSTSTLQRLTVKEICEADIIIVPAGIIEETKGTKGRPYTENLTRRANGPSIPTAPKNGHAEAPTIEGTWVRCMQSGPMIYVGNTAKKKHREEQARYHFCYGENIKKLRSKSFGPHERGVPLEWFVFERVVVDECHECLVSAKGSVSKDSDFKAEARRGAREFIGVGCTDPASRPLRPRLALWGLTGTPLLETEARVIELANLMGGTYLTGSANHWRKHESDSDRNMFLDKQEEGSKSREYTDAQSKSCHAFIRKACQRNRGEELAVKLERKQIEVNMLESEGARFIKSIRSLDLSSYTVTPDLLGDKAADALAVTASSSARHSALFEIIDSIQGDEPQTKIIIFANAVYGGHMSALSALRSSGRPFCHVDDNQSVLEQNEIISWFRHTDATEEDRKRPRILLLSFNQAAGHNLQEACHHVIMYDPMFSSTDAVADTSVEEQALGRVMRQGQTEDVTCYRILVKGPDGERCLDDFIVERNLDENNLRAATSNFD